MVEKPLTGSIHHIQDLFIAVPVSDRLCFCLCNSVNKRGASSWKHMSGCQMEETVHVCHHGLDTRQLVPEIDVCWSSLHLAQEECQFHGVEGDTSILDSQCASGTGLNWGQTSSVLSWPLVRKYWNGRSRKDIRCS